MENLSTASEWTFVFCSVAPDQRHTVWDVAQGAGYGVQDWEWMKPDLRAKSMSGGARQPMCTEYIVVVFKFAASATNHRNMEKHYTLLQRRDQLAPPSGQRLMVGVVFVHFVNIFLFLLECSC